jgi:hypothetical protein
MSSVSADSTANTLHFTVVAQSADQAISLANALRTHTRTARRRCWSSRRSQRLTG